MKDIDGKDNISSRLISHKELLIVAFAVLALILPFAFCSVSEFHFLFDEGGTALLIRNFVDGKLPYRDFGFLYTPLMYYIFTPFMRLYDSLIVPRLINVLFVLAGSVGVYILSCMLIKSRLRLIPPLMYALFMLPVFSVPMPSHLANTLIIFAMIFFLKGKQLHSGVLLALCFLTKQNIGAYAIFGFGLYLLIKRKWLSMLRLGLASLAVMLPYLVFLALTQSLAGFVQYVLLFPFQFAHAINQISLVAPFLDFKPDLLYLAQCGLRLLYIAPVLLYILLSKRALKNDRLLLVLLVCALNYLQFFPNKDPIHFVWGFAPSFILLAYWAGQHQKLAFTLLAGYLVLAVYIIMVFETSPFVNTSQVGLAKTELLLVQPATAKLMNDVMTAVGNSTLFVFGNEKMFYYLSGSTQPSQTELNYFDGDYATAARQASIIQELNGLRPEYVLVSSSKPKDYGTVEAYIYDKYEYQSSVEGTTTHLDIYRLKKG